MNKPVKLILVATGLVFALGIGVMLAGYLWVVSHQSEPEAELARVRAEARELAPSVDQEGCVREALRRTEVCEPAGVRGAGCRGHLHAFFDVCVEAAAPSAGFCDRVPKSADAIGTLAWAGDRCGGLRRSGDRGCLQLVSRIPALCERFRPAPPRR